MKESIRTTVTCGSYVFHLKGRRILERGWMDFYEPYVGSREKDIPTLWDGDMIGPLTVHAEERYTSPPPRYNPASLLRALEKMGLGTKATRAGIVDSLKSRGYTLNDRFELSALGYAVFETMSKYVPELLSAEFTRALEYEMNSIQEGTKTRGEVLNHAKKELTALLSVFKEREEEIGRGLVAGLQRFWRSKVEVGPCPKCGDGTLIIIYSPRTGKRFVGCRNYREGKCDQTFPLPQKGEITPLAKDCPYCGHRMIRIRSRRRTWETCINWAACPGRAEELEALKKRRSGLKEESADD